MRLYGLDEAVRGFGGPIFGTCAGMIVLDRDHLGLGDWRTRRNASAARCTASRRSRHRRRRRAAARRLHPRAVARGAGPDVEVLAEVDGHPVLAREGRLLVAAFHPELTDELASTSGS
jgi:Predicted glutamine amidotransferase involved in pyridoxine biosynthesis